MDPDCGGLDLGASFLRSETKTKKRTKYKWMTGVDIWSVTALVEIRKLLNQLSSVDLRIM